MSTASLEPKSLEEQTQWHATRTPAGTLCTQLASAPSSIFHYSYQWRGQKRLFITRRHMDKKKRESRNYKSICRSRYLMCGSVIPPTNISSKPFVSMQFQNSQSRTTPWTKWTIKNNPTNTQLSLVISLLGKKEHISHDLYSIQGSCDIAGMKI